MSHPACKPFNLIQMKFPAYLFVSFFLLLSLSACSTPPFSEKEWRQEVESTDVNQLYAPHYRDGQYFNPWMDVTKDFSELLRWRFSNSPSYTEEEEAYLPVVWKDAATKIGDDKHGDFILWIGHNSFLIRTGEQVWLTDPIFSKRALLPARHTPPAITAAEINKLFPNVNVIISHSHYDHLDKDSIRELSENYTYYVPMGLEKTLRNWQPNAEIVEMDWWQTRDLSNGVELHCLPAQHWSLRAFERENTSLWASFMLVTPDTTIYFAGDSGYFIGYREIARKYSKIDFALIPTTAYHPRWFMHKAHMNIEEAVRAFQDLGAAYFIPTQWGTFHLGDEPPGYPGLDLKRTIEKKKLEKERYLILGIGEIHRL